MKPEWGVTAKGSKSVHMYRCMYACMQHMHIHICVYVKQDVLCRRGTMRVLWLIAITGTMLYYVV